MATLGEAIINFMAKLNIFNIIFVFILVWVFSYIIIKYFLSNIKGFSDSAGPLASLLGFIVAILTVYNLLAVKFVSYFIQLLAIFIVIVTFGIIIFLFFSPQKETENLLKRLIESGLFKLFIIIVFIIFVLVSLSLTFLSTNVTGITSSPTFNVLSSPGFIGTILFLLFISAFLAIFSRTEKG